MLLARKGLRVLIIDKSAFPSDTLSTHMLKPRAMAYLQRWGLRERLLKAGTPIHDTFIFEREHERLVGAPSPAALDRCMELAHGPGQAHRVEIACTRRIILDEILVRAAQEAGAEVRDRCTVESLIVEDGRVTGVAVRSGESVTTERARVVVGADGRHSKIARWLDAPLIAESSQCTYTVYSYYADIPQHLSLPGVFLCGRLGVGLGATNHGLTMISVWGPAEWFDGFRRDLEGNLLRTVEVCFPELAAAMRQPGRRVERVQGTADLTNAMRQPHGPGWILVGDAGCHLDQCTAIGISHAFRDAELAAHWIARGIGGASALDDALGEYAARRHEELRPQFEYVSTVSRCNAPTMRDLAFFAALQASPGHAARFFGFGAAIVPRSEYFTSAEVDALVAGASSAVPSELEWGERSRQYQMSPWD